MSKQLQTIGSGCEHPCTWYRYKRHRPFAGATKAHTSRPGAPSLYLPGEAIEAIETETVRSPSHRGEGTVTVGRTEYARSAGRVIGWDRGHDATWSFVECSGAIGVEIGAGTRSFHGHPVHESNECLSALEESP